MQHVKQTVKYCVYCVYKFNANILLCTITYYSSSWHFKRRPGSNRVCHKLLNSNVHWHTYLWYWWAKATSGCRFPLQRSQSIHQPVLMAVFPGLQAKAMRRIDSASQSMQHSDIQTAAPMGSRDWSHSHLQPEIKSKKKIKKSKYSF